MQVRARQLADANGRAGPRIGAKAREKADVHRSATKAPPALDGPTTRHLQLPLPPQRRPQADRGSHEGEPAQEGQEVPPAQAGQVRALRDAQETAEDAAAAEEGAGAVQGPRGGAAAAAEGDRQPDPGRLPVGGREEENLAAERERAGAGRPVEGGHGRGQGQVRAVRAGLADQRELRGQVAPREQDPQGLPAGEVAGKELFQRDQAGCHLQRAEQSVLLKVFRLCEKQYRKFIKCKMVSKTNVLLYTWVKVLC